MIRDLFHPQFAAYLVRNPPRITRNARESREVARAMGLYRRQRKKDKMYFCDWCWEHGDTKKKLWLDIHHNIPVSVDPAIADDPDNFTLLCRRCHLCVGHLGNFKNKYLSNIREVIPRARVVQTRSA